MALKDGAGDPVFRQASSRTPAAPQRYIDDLIATARQLLAENASVGDLKVASGALREMRLAFKLFAPYRGVRKVSTFGSARTRAGDPVFRLAEEFSRRIADRGYMVITGAGPGIMEACQRGAGGARSFGINIALPHEQAANPVIRNDPKFLSFHFFFTRKLFFLKEADAVVLFPGGFGTHDEGFETVTLLQTGKMQPLPLVFLDRPRGTYWKTWQRYVEDHLLRRAMIRHEDMALFKVTDNVDAAVDEIVAFYRIYHSSRYVRDKLVIRLTRQLPPPLVETLATEFGDIIVTGGMEQRSAFETEKDDAAVFHLPRLVFRFNRVNFGRLRMLIDRLNQAPEP
jgi:uncharacterized protein (TIGR00730 family)